jgi:uncharacterized DUF497 family protein
MAFEYERAKSLANKRKHGIDFEEAQALWDDLLWLQLRVRKEGEPRYVIIGRIGSKHWSAVITYRGENIRLISVRRSRKDEIELYENDGLR